MASVAQDQLTSGKHLSHHPRGHAVSLHFWTLPQAQRELKRVESIELPTECPGSTLHHCSDDIPRIGQDVLQLSYETNLTGDPSSLITTDYPVSRSIYQHFLLVIVKAPGRIRLILHLSPVELARV